MEEVVRSLVSENEQKDSIIAASNRHLQNERRTNRRHGRSNAFEER